ncbi:MAG: hypothetical protein FJ279_05370 [Planctomycetes bacterium]|nr:hypothetical protein [Planctomycetota bacterium]
MAFQDAVRGPGDGDFLAQMREAVRCPHYTQNEYQIYDNMDTDPQIPFKPTPGRPASRAECIDWLSRDWPGDFYERRLRVRQFCHQHTQEGDEDPQARASVLGHVHELDALAKRLRDAASGETIADAKARLRHLMYSVPSAQRLTEQKRELGSKPLAYYQVWSFYDLPHDNPFAALDHSRSEIVDRLGLGAYERDPMAELVAWSHRLPSGASAKKPTAWDADASQDSVYWRPGGRTQPLHKPRDSGFPEVVHDVVSAQEFVTPMQPLEV